MRHVCKRERAETYMTSYNQAFLCQERYTTSCGHLDWRRCTRYRVQTCYTPRERYAIKYHVVETCCPGWSDDGTGACAIANCGGVCQNEGRCSDVAGTPTCVCQEGYYGDNCQHEKNNWEGWQTIVLCSCGILVVVTIAIAVCVFLRFKKMKTNKRIGPSTGSRHPDPGSITRTIPSFTIPYGLPIHTIREQGVTYPSCVMQSSADFAFTHPYTVHPSAPMESSDT
ncbi:EGF-like and EMI domain-containing protein 1 [Saccostrea echinata]|uniref:EGF-like and EMI domain-containing protein 1 n=1 Tax=Saccostrea echinata TaxID=191078 RepID=UPI002A8415ED|nr:EGF-like and EMI domain-containing protein 1 [Saccostrea echinata]